MKKLISILLSTLLICSMFCSNVVFATENITDSTNAMAIACGKLIDSKENVKFDQNYFFMSELTYEVGDYDGGFIWEISTDKDIKLEASVIRFADSEAKFVTGINMSKIDPENPSIEYTTEVVEFDKNGTQVYSMSDYYSAYSWFAPCHIGVFIQNSDIITEKTTVYIKLYKCSNDGIIGEVFDVVSHTFEAPVSIEGFSEFSKILTDIQFGNSIDATDVYDALKESADNESKEALNALLDDDKLAIIKKALTDVYTTISVTDVDGIEMPYAALATVPGETSTVYTPVVEEKNAISDKTNNTKTYTYDIKLNVSKDNGVAETLSTPAVKQKVVLELPPDLDGNNITVKHGENQLKSKVANGKVSFFTDSFSEFTVAGTVNDASDESDKVEQVTYEISQDADNPNKFILSISPVGEGKRIVRFANAPMRVEFKNVGKDISEEEAMKSFAYTNFKAATGITIENKTDIEKNGSTIGGFTFIAMAEDTKNLYTAGAGQAIPIAEFEVTGHGKFYAHLDCIDEFEKKIYTETVEDNKVELATVNVDPQGSKVFNLEEKKLALSFYIDFGNEIKDTRAEYIGMTITVNGIINSDKEYTLKVGNISDEDVANGVASLTVSGNSASGSIEVPANDRYEFEISGAGYRTFRGNVLLNTPKKVNLWTYAETDYNTAGEEVPFDKAVIEGEDTIMKDVTFLVGDIYMDNIVDIYDISAVLSYYGKKDIQVGDEYIAQDLNRDGKINSLDLALVQASYGN